jgi:hypothetical protein
MKKLVLLTFALFGVMSFTMAQNPTTMEAKKVGGAEFKWEKTAHNFGKIIQGKPVTVTYSFTNIGKEPLVIKSVNPSCGCTAGDYTKEPIAPGKKGFVKATYNAASMGKFSKSITVVSNATQEMVQLTIEGEVITETNGTGDAPKSE